MSRWHFGDITVDRILEFEEPLLPASFLYPVSAAEEWESQVPWLKPYLLDPESGLLNIAFHTFVIRTSRHIILVDACSGNQKPRPQKPRYHMNDWPYLENLAAVGVKPEDVDLLIFTHLHVDHVGWNTMLSDGRWIPTFPNAKYLFIRQEWAHWERHYRTPAFTDDPYYKDSILPVIDSGQMMLIEADHAIDEGLTLEPTPGHTPGHVCIHISSGGKKAVMCGDIMHHPVQCTFPDWNSCFCVDDGQARKTRYAFLDQYAETDVLIMPSHFPTPAVGRIVRADKNWRFSFEGAREG